MKKFGNLGRNLLILAGLILIGAAAFILFAPERRDRDYQLIIGGAFALVSVICFLSFGANRRMYFRPGWLLQSAFFMLIFSVILFFLPYLSFEMNVMVYAFLAFFFAASQFGAAIQLMALEIRRWWLVLIFALNNLIFGIYFIKLCSVFNLSEYPSVAIFMIVTGGIIAAEQFVYKKNN